MLAVCIPAESRQQSVVVFSWCKANERNTIWNKRQTERDRERKKKTHTTQIKETTLESKWTKPCRTGFKTRNSIYFIVVVFFFHENMTCCKCIRIRIHVWFVYVLRAIGVASCCCFFVVHFYRIQHNIETNAFYWYVIPYFPLSHSFYLCLCASAANVFAMQWQNGSLHNLHGK